MFESIADCLLRFYTLTRFWNDSTVYCVGTVYGLRVDGEFEALELV